MSVYLEEVPHRAVFCSFVIIPAFAAGPHRLYPNAGAFPGRFESPLPVPPHLKMTQNPKTSLLRRPVQLKVLGIADPHNVDWVIHSYPALLPPHTTGDDVMALNARTQFFIKPLHGKPLLAS